MFNYGQQTESETTRLLQCDTAWLRILADCLIQSAPQAQGPVAVYRWGRLMVVCGAVAGVLTPLGLIMGERWLLLGGLVAAALCFVVCRYILSRKAPR